MTLTRIFTSFLIITIFISSPLLAQDTVHYTGTVLSNIDYHTGQLRSAVGVHNVQVARADREYPEKSDGYGWTYNHAPMMVYWNNTFYVQYLSNPVGEHIPPGMSFMVSSEDGTNWTKPTVMFPIYPIPDGTTKDGVDGVAKDLDAVMHQRMGFYIAENGKLLTLAYYGIALNRKDHPNDGNGIGRVVREIYEDGTLGPIYFIRYNHGWNQENTAYPFYKESDDEGFVKACDELMADPLMMQQWVEEADRDDPLIPLKDEYKAFSYYHLDDDRVVGLWKHALTSISNDGGKSWEYTPLRAPGFVNSNAKIWGQKTTDDRFATVYNPSEFRWPLAISVSEDGLEYDNLLLVHGEITPMRYGGNYKSYGPQYVRGILEGNGVPPDGNLWLTYSVNKEDIWVAQVPVPVTDVVEGPVNDVFSEMPNGAELDAWNTYSPIWATAKMEGKKDKKAFVLRDKDPFDYAKAERVLPKTQVGSIEIAVIPGQNDTGLLHIELQSGNGTPAIRVIFDERGKMLVKNGYRLNAFADYEAGQAYKIRIDFDVPNRVYSLYVNDKFEIRRMFFAPVPSIEKLMFRTGEVRRFPNADTPTDQDYDLPGAGEEVPMAYYKITSVKMK
ncbi:exo-alpha-sialidase [Marinoscillum sp. MHG1-6]|uniref:exo-alpha-sialidase n=1 Tax=Marinoscillum sp. MHG1-6 TaxID=2959627 RepID=UPI0021576A11|nr:exo-alpha-sialidase [Marinoscillum sp. MHG1-6]